MQGSESNRMQPVFEMNIQYQGESITAPWSVAYYFFGY